MHWRRLLVQTGWGVVAVRSQILCPICSLTAPSPNPFARRRQHQAISQAVSGNGKVEGSNPSHGTISFSGVWLTPNSRGDSLRNCEPWRCKSSHADQPFNGFEFFVSGFVLCCSQRVTENQKLETNVSRRVNQTSVLALFAKQWVPLRGDVVQVHGLPPFFKGRSLK